MALAALGGPGLSTAEIAGDGLLAALATSTAQLAARQHWLPVAAPAATFADTLEVGA